MLGVRVVCVSSALLACFVEYKFSRSKSALCAPCICTKPGDYVAIYQTALNQYILDGIQIGVHCCSFVVDANTFRIHTRISPLPRYSPIHMSAHKPISTQLYFVWMFVSTVFALASFASTFDVRLSFVCVCVCLHACVHFYVYYVMVVVVYTRAHFFPFKRLHPSACFPIHIHTGRVNGLV